MDHDRDLALLKEIIRQLAELDKVVKSKLRLFLKGKDKDEIKDVLRELDKPSLDLLCEMSLPEEDYEICAAVQITVRLFAVLRDAAGAECVVESFEGECVTVGDVRALYEAYPEEITPIFSQIGAIILIGIAAKNGILIVEFANQLRDEGASVRDAVLDASVIRLRPIMMTVISTILGAVPLVLATGAGAESRIAIGTVIIGGLGFASILTLFLTPVLYNLMAGWSKPRRAAEYRLEAELGRLQPGE